MISNHHHSLEKKVVNQAFILLLESARQDSSCGGLTPMPEGSFYPVSSPPGLEPHA